MSDEIRFTLQNGKGWEGDLPVDAFCDSSLKSVRVIGQPCPDFVVYPRAPEFEGFSGLRATWSRPGISSSAARCARRKGTRPCGGLSTALR
jgi:hypothetical protein